MKRVVLLAAACLFSVTLLAGCGASGGHIKYYTEPVLQFTPGVTAGETDLTASQARTVRRVLRSVREWYDDRAVNRLEFYFDGEFTLSNKEWTYYFSYDSNVIYYDHFFGEVSETRMAALRDLLGPA